VRQTKRRNESILEEWLLMAKTVHRLFTPLWFKLPGTYDSV